MSGARSSTGTATTGTAEARRGARDTEGSARPRGRFAPSPTGDLHLGSLVAAVGSYLSARCRGGNWLVRIEDIDRTREVPGAADRILRTLEAFGFEWDGPVTYQSRRSGLYESALSTLADAGLTYPCACTRRQLAELARGSDGEPVHPGTCPPSAAQAGLPPALRFRTEPGESVCFVDEFQGPFEQVPAAAVGDFVVRRRDGFHAYQLAVVVDDADQGVTEVVRGTDLLDNTPRQILLQRSLGLGTPAYGHLPLLTEAGGAKLSKSRRTVPLDAARAPPLLVGALRALCQAPPAALERSSVAEIWAWAMEHWSPARLVGVRAMDASQVGVGSHDHLAVR